MTITELFKYRQDFASKSYDKLKMVLGRHPEPREWSIFFDQDVSKEPQELWTCGYNRDYDECEKELGRPPSQKELSKFRERKTYESW